MAKKVNTLIATFALLSLISNSQTLDTLFADFETPSSFVKNMSGSWQIGVPAKTIFNGSYSPTKSLITNTLNPYPVNDSSVFYLKYGPVQDYLGYYSPIQLNFYHRFDTDTIADFGTIHFSINGGQSWINGLSSIYTSTGSSDDNFHKLLSSGNTVYTNFKITGNSNGWVHSRITVDLSNWVWNTGFNPVDSVSVKFTFKSDAIDNSKDGWQIDNVSMRYLMPSGMSENNMDSDLNIFPNPSSNLLNVNFSKQVTIISFKIFSSAGQELIHKEGFISGKSTLDISELFEGVYFLEIKTNDGVARRKLIKN